MERVALSKGGWCLISSCDPQLHVTPGLFGRFPFSSWVMRTLMRIQWSVQLWCMNINGLRHDRNYPWHLVLTDKNTSYTHSYALKRIPKPITGNSFEVPFPPHFFSISNKMKIIVDSKINCSCNWFDNTMDKMQFFSTVRSLLLFFQMFSFRDKKKQQKKQSQLCGAIMLQSNFSRAVWRNQACMCLHIHSVYCTDGTLGSSAAPQRQRELI